MLMVRIGKGQHRAVPLTHRHCIAAGFKRPTGGANSARPWVQVKRYHPQGSYVLCGQVVELRENGEEWFKVETDIGPVWASSRNVRMCSGDGRCTCEEAPGAEGSPSNGLDSPALAVQRPTQPGAGDV